MSSRQAQAPRRSGHTHPLLRMGWPLLVLATTGVVAFSSPLRWGELLTVSADAVSTVGQLRPQDVDELRRAGLTVAFYATYFTLLEILTAVVFIGTAALILWKSHGEAAGLLTATLLLLSALVMPTAGTLARLAAELGIILLLIRAGFILSLIFLLFLFPDGRIVPQWTRWLLPVWVIYMLIGLVWPDLYPPFAYGDGLTPDQVPSVLWMLAWLLLGVGAQVYRYRRVSTPAERQQTKWAVYGFSIFLMCFAAGIILLAPVLTDPVFGMSVVRRLSGPTCILIGAMALPVTLLFSMLRYRLWDIDLIIRRTLVYSSLTGLLALIYFATIILLQAVFEAVTGQQSQLAIVLSTLAIAALFIPLRNRIQAGIDRRFYRKKYNAQQVLAQFAITARDETDMNALTSELARVVKDTVAPERVKVWLKR